MADRDVLIKPRKVEVTPSTTIANLLTKIKAITTLSGTVSGAAQDEIFALPIDGTAGLFIGDMSGKVQGATETDNASTAMTPVTTQTGLLPRDLLNAPSDVNAGNFMVHMYDGNTTPTVANNRHRAFSLLKLKDYIGGAAVASIGKVKVDATDGADWLEEKIENAGVPNSFISLNIEKIGVAPTKTIQFNATPNLSNQFFVTGARQLTILSISGGSI